MPYDEQKPNVSAALNAAIDHNAEVVKRGRSHQRPTFLKRLGLSLPVTPADVKQAFLQKAKVAHPDRNGNGDGEQFKRLQEAFDEAIRFAERNGKRLPWIGLQMPIYIAQRAIIGMVKNWGGEVEVNSLEWLENTVGEDFTAIADRLVEINLSGCDVGDAELSLLAGEAEGLQFLEVLRLRWTNVSDAGMLQVAQAPNLRYLDVRGTKVSRSMRGQLARLPQMHHVEGAGGWFDWLPWR